MELNVQAVGEDLVSLWGREGLNICPESALSDVTLPEASKRLLTEYGLPACWGAEYFFDLKEKLPRFNEACPHFRIIGVFHLSATQSINVCLDEQRDGAIVLASHGEHNPLKNYLNSSVESYAAHLVLHRKLMSGAVKYNRAYDQNIDADPLQHLTDEEVSALYEKEVIALIDETETEMRRLEPQIWAGLERVVDDHTDETQWERYWPGLLSEFYEYAMWDIEDAYENWVNARF